LVSNKILVLDANVFIEAARRYYAFDIAPKFWKSLVLFLNKGEIISIDRIKSELELGNDDLIEWAKKDFANGFASSDDTEVIECYRKIMEWVSKQNQFFDTAIRDFAKIADGWLIAYAMSNDCIVVTHELLDLNSKRKIPIPNICKAFNIQYIDTFEMLRRLRVRFN